MYEMGKPCLQRLGQLEVIGYDIINTEPIKNQKWGYRQTVIHCLLL